MVSMLIASMPMRQAPCQMHAACEGEIIAAPGKDTRQLRNDGARWGCGLARLQSLLCAVFICVCILRRARHGGCVVCSYCSRGTRPGYLCSAPAESSLHSLHAHALTLHHRKRQRNATQRNASNASLEHKKVPYQGWLVIRGHGAAFADVGLVAVRPAQARRKQQ